MNHTIYERTQQIATVGWLMSGRHIERLVVFFAFGLLLAWIIGANSIAPKLQDPSETAVASANLTATAPIIVSRTNIVAPPSQTSQWERPKPGWLYVLDYSQDQKTASGADSEILLVDPQQGHVKGRIVAGDSPDILLSPDGTRLYIASILEIGDSLSIIDTTSGTVLQTVPLHNRWRYTIVSGNTTMGISQDGRWLYILKLYGIPIGDPNRRPRQFIDKYTVAAFDTTHGVFLPEEAPVPHCLFGMMFSSPDDQQVQVLCSGSNAVHFLRLTPSGLAVIAPKLALPRGADKQRPVVATGIRLRNGDLFAIMSDGRVMEIDSNLRKITRSLVKDWLADRWVPQDQVFCSPDGTKLYVAVGRLVARSTGKVDEILVFETSGGQLLGTIKTSRPFWSLAMSPDGQYLYGISRESRSLLVIDANTYQEMRTISGIGVEPARALVAP